MKQMLAIAVLLLVLAAVASLPPTARAQDAGSRYVAPEGSFARTVPLIPGYNAPYPTPGGAQTVNDAPILVAAQDSFSYGPQGSFATTPPRIPGYNADYPELGQLAAQR